MATSTQNHIGALELGYAQALADLATEADSFDEIADEIHQIGEIVESDAEFNKLLGSHILGTADRAKILEKVFAGRVSPLTFNFLQVVNNKGRLDHLEGIAAAFAMLADQRSGRIEIDAYVANAMSDDQVATVAKQIGTAIGKTVTLNQHIDPALIGGLKIQVGDRLIDGSVAAQLKKLQVKMVAAGREKAKQL